MTTDLQKRAAAHIGALSEVMPDGLLKNFLSAVAGDIKIYKNTVDLGERLVRAVASLVSEVQESLDIPESVSGRPVHMLAESLGRPTSIEVVQDCLALVGVYAKKLDLMNHTQQEREEACDWAGECIMAANGHDVTPRPKPAWLPEAGKPPEWWCAP